MERVFLIWRIFVEDQFSRSQAVCACMRLSIALQAKFFGRFASLFALDFEHHIIGF
jgi:hypothetical protein